MKTFIISCNYNEGKTGNLEKHLISLKNNKLDNTIISIVDNNSKDNSKEIIKNFIDNKTLNFAFLQKENKGKAVAFDELVSFLETKYKIEDDDLIIHMDSDIELLTNDWLKRVIEICNTYKYQFGCMAFPCFDFTISNNKNNYWPNGIHPYKQELLNDDSVYFLNSKDIPGYTLAIPYKIQKSINGYETKFKYGADDACLILKINKGLKLPIIVSNKTVVNHPECKDKEYQKYKINAINDINVNKWDLNKCHIANKGFYD